MTLPITVRDALKLEPLRECRVLAGSSSLDRLVSSVSVVEVPDVWRWLHGGEMLLTTMYPFKDNLEAQLDLVRQIASKGASCLVVKTGRFIDVVSPEVVELAEEKGLPLLEISRDVNFLHIVHSVHAVVMETGLDVMQESEKLRHEVLHMVAEGKDIQSIVTFMAHCFQNPVSLYDCDGKLIALAGDDIPDRLLLALSKVTVEVLASLTETTPQSFDEFQSWGKHSAEVPRRGPDVPRLVIASEARGVCYGYLAVWDGSKAIPRAAVKAVDSFALAVAFEMAREMIAREVERKYVSQFIRQLIFTGFSDDVAQQQAMSMGLRLGDVTLVISVSSAAISEIESLVRDSAQRHNQFAVASQVGTDLVVIWPVYGTKDLDLLGMRELIVPWYRKLISMAGSPLRVCIGKPARSSEEIPEAYRTSQECLSLLDSLDVGKSALIFFSELGLMRLLALCPKKELKAYRMETLGPILEYDEENQGSLEDTLFEYLLSNGNQAEAAKRLFIHPNTLRYRLAKISDMLGVNLDDAAVRATLWAGVMIGKFGQDRKTARKLPLS